MRKITLAAVIAAAAYVSGATAQAMPALQAAPSDGGIVQVSGGCGPGGHRGPYGRCYPNRLYRACPPRMHLDRFGRCRWN